MNDQTLVAIQQLPKEQRQAVTAYMMTNEKSVQTAQVLAFFLGGFGAHHFYLGNTVQGFMYILFFITFIPMIFAFVEIFLMTGIVAKIEANQLQKAMLIYAV